jgi:hypothetical protein
MAKALFMGLGAASLGGWLLTSPDFHLGTLFELILAFAYGTGLGEIVLRVTGRKRGIQMEALAGAVAVAGVIIGRLINTASHGMPEGADFISLYVANPMALVMFAVSAFGAVNRVRFFM